MTGSWYKNGLLIDSNVAGLKVHPDSTFSYVMQLDVCGHITTDTVIVWVQPVGTHAFEPALVRISPNPSSKEIQIERVENCEVEIYNCVGYSMKKIIASSQKETIYKGEVEHEVFKCND